jgi:hypothetical protein
LLDDNGNHAAYGGNIASGSDVMADQRRYQFSDLGRGDIQMKKNYVLSLIICLILFLSVILAHAATPTVTVAAASAKDTAPTGIAMSSGGSWFTDNSIDSLSMAYLPLVSRLEKVGEQLFIYYSGSQTFPAGSPFHIVHGFAIGPDVEQPFSEFQLQVDGVYREEDFIIMKPGEHRFYVFNFYDGMTGTHLFSGHWLAPCGQDCPNPDEIIVVHTSNVIVTFVP